MNNLPKQVLNYFATFTETRFNFRRLINYKWTNTEHTLDFSFFPKFESNLIDLIKNGELEPIAITQGEYAISIKKDDILDKTLDAIKEEFDSQLLEKLITEEENNLKISEETDPESIERKKNLAKEEGLRLFNLKLRRKFEEVLVKLQHELTEKLKVELNVEHNPPSIFGIANYINQHFEKIKHISLDYQDASSYIDSVKQYFKENIQDIVIYDLFYNLQKYLEFTQLGTLFLFFHNLEKKDESFPLYFVEAELKSSNNEIVLSFPRKLVLLNTPAINYFKFDTVITIPRASSPSLASSHLSSIEAFFQNQYGFQTPFVLEPAFNSISHQNENYPQIKSRIGLQIVEKEDKKLLDYSELMTKLELGGSSKFSEFIDQYIKGTVPNHQEEVDQKFKNDYPIHSPKRYISDSPIPLNNSQKRILLALANSKNNIIVVDGPPGTGKSHTIAALTYWANENKKSVVVTSHKKEALDVIDRMLSDKFRKLHPQSKPSIIRMDSETGSQNNLINTLQNSVINAANERCLNFNTQAFTSDKESLEEKVKKSVETRLRCTADYRQYIKDVVTLFSLEKEFETESAISQVMGSTPRVTEPIQTNLIDSLVLSGDVSKLSGVTFEEYLFLLSNKQNIPQFIEACEKINQLPEDTFTNCNSIPEIPQKFVDLIQNFAKHFKSNIPINQLTVKDTNGGIFQKIIGQGPKEASTRQLLIDIKSLENRSTLTGLSQYLNKDLNTVTIDDILTGIQKAQFAITVKPYYTLISSYKEIPGNSQKDLVQIYESIKRFTQAPGVFNNENAQTINQLFNTYAPLLSSIGVVKEDLGTLSFLSNTDPKKAKVWQWIKLHAVQSLKNNSLSLNKADAELLYKLHQKEVENVNDIRLKELNNHLGDIARIKVSYEGGKRFSKEETETLLSSISCVIAEPSTISQYFPMEEGIIDVLIIDEASQVSIADSISLILRAKQVVIFGDEYQYGAVGAINVSSKYSTSYFSEIVSAYSEDYQTTVSEKEKQELVEEVSREINPEEQQSDTLLKPQEGTILWLKTFDIRTSTLTFAKAIANYTTSLKEHFRSFPEIIGYSNDFFYKEAQMELLVNRIRTKAIGEVLQFIQVKCQGKSGANTNLDEIEAIGDDIQKRLDAGFKGSIGIITSFKEQQARLEQYLNERFNMPILVRDHKLAVWFVGDVQGEERDLVYYSFVEDNEVGNANLASIYPVIDGSADNIRSLKMQRLNVGFSRAKDTMVFVHSQPLERFSNTRLGDALKHYQRILEANKANDFFIEDETQLESEMERKVYSWLLQTQFVQSKRDRIKIIPQFKIGQYIAREYEVSIPKYRADFLVSYADGGKEKVLILEYDGLEYHFKNPYEVDQMNFSQEYIDYDVSRQLELENYGYHFLRLNKFNLRPQNTGETEVDVLNRLLVERF